MISRETDCFVNEIHDHKEEVGSSNELNCSEWSNFTKFRIPVWTIINSNTKNSNLLENLSESVLTNCLEMLVLVTNWTI